MGFFSDQCVNPDCKGRVPKAAKFCRTCGTPAPDADTTCGGCGATISSASKFCWKCGGDLDDQRKVPLFDNHWARGQDDFAIRVDDCDVKGFLSKGLIVEHGTKGLVFQRGAFCGIVEGGRYDTNGFLKRVNHFNQTNPTSVVLVDAGDVEFHLEAIKLYSAEHLEVDAMFKAVVRLRDPETFYVNAFKGRQRLSANYIAGSIADELRAALQSFVGTHSIESLYNNANMRTEVERQMQLQIEPILERLGLEMVQLRFVDFFCPTYDPLREEQATLFVDTRKTDIDIDRLKLTQRLRKEMSGEKMDQFKNEKDFEDFVRQTEHELGLKDIVRADEMDRLTRQFAHERNHDLLTQEIEIEGIRSDADRIEARKALDAKLEQFRRERDTQREDRVAEGEAGVKVRDLEHEQDMKEAIDAVNLRKQVEDVEHQKAERGQKLDLDRQTQEQRTEAERLKSRSQASVEALMSIMDGAGADKLAEIEKLRTHQNLSPEQIIAMTAADSPDVARALAEKYKAEAAMSDERFKQMETFFAQQQATSQDSADRMERMLNVSLQQMGLTASTRAQAPSSSQTVVTSGGGIGGGPPVVVNPQQPGTDATCPKCKGKIPSDSQFCPECGKKV